MTKIKSLLIAKETSAWVDYPDIDGFKVNLVFLTREDLLKIRNASLTYKFSKKTRQREEELDSEKFISNYAEKAILGWKGLKVKHLPTLLPVDISGVNLEEEIAYSQEEAIELLTNSTSFDQFVSESLSAFENFTKHKSDTEIKN